MSAVASEMQVPKKRVLIGSVGILQGVLKVAFGAGRAIPGAKAEWSRRWASIIDWSVPHVGHLALIGAERSLVSCSVIEGRAGVFETNQTEVVRYPLLDINR
jgi:hypothetical protein